MSHPMPHDNDDSEDDDLPMLKPKPKRPFELSSPPPSEPSTPGTSPTIPTSLQAPKSSMDGTSTPSRNRSFLNLTSSTLFGIYQPTGYAADREELSTPWGTGAQTPAATADRPFDFSRSNFQDTVPQTAPTSAAQMRRRSTAAHVHIHHAPRRGFKGYILPLLGRVVALFGVGMLYGLLLRHLHDQQDLAPVKVELNRSSWTYLIWWGIAGALFGEALPWVDTFWAAGDDEDDEVVEERQRKKGSEGLSGWIDVVRSMGAFVGIAFAIRKLPWQSSLQLSLTLALANPAIWFIVDRSPPGFVMSTLVALAGTAVLLGINPALIPSPSPAQVLRDIVSKSRGANGIANLVGSEELVLGIFTQESVGVPTWIASVLFVSSVCFGNIGRRLAPQKP